MIPKEKTYKEKDNDEKKGKKRFIERLAEDQEAKQAIDEYLKGRDDEDIPDYPRVD